MQQDKFQCYDLIGDIHGHYQSLMALLAKLGYANDSEILQDHPEGRRLIFLGDLIDRGPAQRETVDLVRSLVESGKALCVMGNHEFNALAFSTSDQNNPGSYLRPHSQKNIGQHKEFLAAYRSDEEGKKEVLEWFRTLPMWLDLPGLRVIHACWDELAIARISNTARSEGISEEFLAAACEKSDQMYADVETILKGKEVKLPPGRSVLDKQGIERHEIRVRWWDTEVSNFREAYIGPEGARTDIPEDPIEGDHLVEHSHDGPPVFLGHYWLDPENIQLLASNIACLDFSIASNRGKLVAYRWDGEQKLSNRKFCWVDRQEAPESF